MKLLIIDKSNYHFDYLRTLYEVFKDEEIIYNISSFLESELKKYTGKEIKNIKNENLYCDIKESLKQEADYIFINTLQNNWFFYFILGILISKNKKIILTIHNINSFFYIPSRLKDKIKFFIKRLWLNKSSYINVYGENLKDYLINNKKNKKITTIPFSCFESKEKINSELKSELILSIPGGFENRRRDYESIYEVFKRLEKEKIDIKLLLLGKLVDNSSKELFYKFKNLNNVECFENYIEYEKFDKLMKKTDIFIGPVQKYIEVTKGIFEEYGITKETGFTFAQITYAKPGILPMYIKKYKELESSSLQYENVEELYEIIMKIYKDREYLENLKRKAYENSLNFTSNNIKRKFLEELK